MTIRVTAETIHRYIGASRYFVSDTIHRYECPKYRYKTIHPRVIRDCGALVESTPQNLPTVSQTGQRQKYIWEYLQLVCLLKECSLLLGTLSLPSVLP